LKRISVLIDVNADGIIGGARAYDCAQGLNSILRQKGYKTFLTRHKNSSLFCVDRFQLATQLHADVCLSVDNGTVSITGCFNEKQSVGEQNGTFSFVKTSSDRSLAKFANAAIKSEGSESREILNKVRSLLRGYLKPNETRLV
jgi:N-acetylmuramoyl-L-alanine amidase